MQIVQVGQLNYYVLELCISLLKTSSQYVTRILRKYNNTVNIEKLIYHKSERQAEMIVAFELVFVHLKDTCIQYPNPKYVVGMHNRTVSWPVA